MKKSPPKENIFKDIEEAKKAAEGKTVSPKSLMNLRNGGPGRNKSKNYSTIMDIMFEATCELHHLEDDANRAIYNKLEEDLGRKPTRQEMMFHAQFYKAMNGNLRSLESLMNRRHGTPVQTNKNENTDFTLDEWVKMQNGEYEE